VLPPDCETFRLCAVTLELLARLLGMQREGLIERVEVAGVVFVRLPCNDRARCRQIVGDALKATNCLEKT
jgi:BarA-like signal transduction histidine kinase